MISTKESLLTASYIHELQNSDGGYAAIPSNSISTMQSTFSAIKILLTIKESPANPEGVIDFVEMCFGKLSGGFSEHPSHEASVQSTARGLLILNSLGAYDTLNKYLNNGIEFISNNAESAFDHFMLITVWKECNASGPIPFASIDYFMKQRDDNGLFGDSILNNCIAFASLLQSGIDVGNRSNINNFLLGITIDERGFSYGDKQLDLLTMFMVMQIFYSLNWDFNFTPVMEFIKRFRNVDGGFGAEPGIESDVNTSYMLISILNWVSGLYNHKAVEAARRGDVGDITKRLEEGWDPNGKDSEGWNALLAAASRGQSKVVELLLFHNINGAKHADPNIRFTPADGLPIFMAGQKGDTQTVKLLLKANPDHIYEISKVNGHTVLLQAAFYGLEQHRELAKYLLDNVGDILSIPKQESSKREEAVKKLTTATYVRGLTALDIAKFWKNKPMQQILEEYVQPTEVEKKAYFDNLKKIIALKPPATESEKKKQQLSEDIMTIIVDGLNSISKIPDSNSSEFVKAKESIFASMNPIIKNPDFQINRLASFLLETPVIMALTGHDTNQNQKQFRLELVKYLLDHGGNPDKPEKHPMGVDAIIRSAVLHHFEVLKLISKYMKLVAFTAALNTIPGINGQTALYDTVHQTLKADKDTLPGYIEQISWCIAHGAKTNIAEFTGKTIRDLADEASKDPATKANAIAVLNELKKAKE